MMLDKRPTPDPWEWDLRGKEIRLIRPRCGTLTVMDFVRLGMRSATARFSEWSGTDRDRQGGLMRPAHEIDLANHPDARLIQTAPVFLSACELLR
jgi:hypothetical protein